MTAPSLVVPRKPPLQVGNVTAGRVALSEWTKLRSLRSTRYSLLVALLATIGLAALVATVTVTHWKSVSPDERANFSALDRSLIGALFAQLAIGVLGVLVITGEYSTGMIRSTFGAVPRRLPVLWAKAAVYGAVVFALSLPAVLIAFFTAQAIFSNQHIQTSFSNPGVARSVIGAALYLTAIGLLGLALGAIVRNTAGGIATFAGVLFILPVITAPMPASWANAIDPYLPNNAGQAIMSATHQAHRLSAWGGFALFCAYIGAAFAVAAVLLVRRDT